MNTLLIVISGVDGSGKTSLIEKLQAALEAQGKPTRYLWLRYNHYLSKFVLAFCRYTGLTRYLYFENSRVVYHDFYRSRLVSWLFIGTTWIDTFFVSLFKVYLYRLFSRKVIICDRWMYDIMVDLEVDTKIEFADHSRLKKTFLSLLPANALCFVISRDMESVRKERDESLNDDNFSVRSRLYLRHAQDGKLITVDNNGTIEESVQQVLRQAGLSDTRMTEEVS